MTAIAILVVIGFYLHENRDPDYRRLSAAETAELAAVLRARGLPPAAYVLQKFEDHPVVILGEPHRVREHYEFLTGLLPLLPEAGVHQVAFELFRASSQPDIDQLIAGGAFDEPLARRILFSAAPWFYYEELYELLRKGWQVNRTSRLRIVALWGVNDRAQAELVESAVSQAGKMLVYCGTHHAFTRYHLPGHPAGEGPRRMGQYLELTYRRSPFFIQLHYPLAKRYFYRVPVLLYRQAFCLPFGGVLDQAFQALAAPVGFDTAYKELDRVVDGFSYYAQGRSRLRLSEFCDGYIFLKPIRNYQFVRPLHGIAASDEDRKTLRAILGDETQKRLFGSDVNALRFLGREGFNTAERMRAHTDLRGLKGILLK